MSTIRSNNRDGSKMASSTLPTPPKPSKITDPSISRERIGIWQLITMREPLSSKIIGFHWIRPVPFTLVYRFLRDIHSINPLLMMIFMLTRIWDGMQFGVTLNASGNLLMVVRAVSTVQNELFSTNETRTSRSKLAYEKKRLMPMRFCKLWVPILLW